MCQVKSFLPSGAGDPDLNRSVELHMQCGRDVSEDEGTVATEYHYPSGTRLLHEPGVLLNHLRVLSLSQRDACVIQNGCTWRKAA